MPANGMRHFSKVPGWHQLGCQRKNVFRNTLFQLLPHNLYTRLAKQLAMRYGPSFETTPSIKDIRAGPPGVRVPTPPHGRAFWMVVPTRATAIWQLHVCGCRRDGALALRGTFILRGPVQDPSPLRSKRPPSKSGFICVQSQREI